MIEDYEKEMIEFFKRAITDLKLVDYAEEEEIFELYNVNTVYPALYYSRMNEEQAMTKALKTTQDDPAQDYKKDSTSFFVVPMKYKATVMIKTQKDALKVQNDLRMYWRRNPYLLVATNLLGEENIRVGLRFLYIKIEEKRNNKNEKGPLRIVECGWMVQLYLTSQEKVPVIKNIKVTVNNEYPKEFNLP